MNEQLWWRKVLNFGKKVCEYLMKIYHYDLPIKLGLFRAGTKFQ